MLIEQLHCEEEEEPFLVIAFLMFGPAFTGRA